jgi:hypothetical protein
VTISEKGQQLRDYAAYLVEVMPRWIQEARVTQMDELEVCPGMKRKKHYISSHIFVLT